MAEWSAAGVAHINAENGDFIAAWKRPTGGVFLEVEAENECSLVRLSWDEALDLASAILRLRGRVE